MGQKSIVYDNTNISEEYLIKLLDVLKTMKFGSVTLVVQDGSVIQIERNEKIRFK